VAPPGHVWPFTFLQLPLPLHALLPLHTGLLSGIPTGTFAHVPRLPLTLHAWHMLVQVLLQQ